MFCIYFVTVIESGAPLPALSLSIAVPHIQRSAYSFALKMEAAGYSELRSVTSQTVIFVVTGQISGAGIESR
jgi:hypothetical protein